MTHLLAAAVLVASLVGSAEDSARKDAPPTDPQLPSESPPAVPGRQATPAPAEPPRLTAALPVGTAAEAPRAKHLSAAEAQPLAGALGDPLRAALVLPGVSTLLSGLGYAVVRGQIPATVRYEYDGVALPMPFHLHALHSVVHPALVGGVELTHAASDPTVGRRLSAAIRLLPDAQGARLRARAGLDLLNVSLYGQLPAGGSHPELTASGRFALTPFLAATAMGLGAPSGAARQQLLMGDWQLRGSAELLGGDVRLLVLGVLDRVGSTGVGEAALGGAASHRADLRLRRPLGKGELKLGLTWGWDGVGGEGGGAISRLRVLLSEQLYRARATYRILALPSVALEVGADAEYRVTRLSQGNRLRPGDPVDATRPEVVSAVTQTLGEAVVGGLHARTELRLGALRLVPGGRVDLYQPLGHPAQVTVEPRVEAQWRPGGPLTLRAAFGTTHQPPTYLVDLPGVEAASMRHGLQALVEVETGADYALGEDATASATIYAHPYLRTIELSLFEADFLAIDPGARVAERRTTGSAAGLELSFQRRWADDWFGRAAYALHLGVRRGLVARRDPTGAVVRHEPGDYAPSHEQSHVVNAAVGRVLGDGWRLTGGLSFHTGAPEAGGLYSFTQREGRDAAGNRRWVPADRDAVARLPPHYRLDIRLDKAWRLGEDLELAAHAEVQNFTLSREVFRWSYLNAAERSPVAQLDKQPMGLPPIVLPSVGLELRYR